MQAWCGLVQLCESALQVSPEVLAGVTGLVHTGGGRQTMGHACTSHVCTAIIFALCCVLALG
jgi:hypothetical protein